ncbi:hypothetical protein D9613_004258 [Agrocybe pediades]|uniref:Uncharacterized protein n=1 Tax=Agrocybe pediades TaxID=84607 RepID=A0A8H4VLJ5_9AGAR|nr:hypothetical protein D9613_004258 [Agrocybe pediades]
MSSKVDSSLNAAGLKPEETKNLPERSPNANEQPVLAGLRELYSCKPTEASYSYIDICMRDSLTGHLQRSFDIYSQDAVFHDPVGIAKGISSVRAQFMALAKIFEHADIPKFRLLQNPPTVPSNVLLIDQDVAYYRKGNSSSPTKTVNSLLTVKLDNSNKILSHTEEWDHKKTATSEDGFLGMLNEERKKFTAAVTEMMVGEKPKN